MRAERKNKDEKSATTGQLYAIGSGTATVNNLTGKSTVEMKTKSTFTLVGWDFAPLLAQV